MSETDARTSRLPPWLKKRFPAGKTGEAVQKILTDLGLNTVCRSAACPNLAECFARRTATFMILGDRCSRGCRFCAVRTGVPMPVRGEEPAAVAEAAVQLGLRHVVVTSVTRDDLPDGGARQFALTILAVRSRLPGAVIEVLTPDFQGRRPALLEVLLARPDIFNHNLETVPRLYPTVRPQADYARSLDLLREAKNWARTEGVKLYTKSGLMVGLGERDDEVRRVMADLRAADCDILTIGQYLAPSSEHLPVAEYVEPARFAVWEEEARRLGFISAAAGPFVRSSYQAEQVFERRRDNPGSE